MTTFASPSRTFNYNKKQKQEDLDSTVNLVDPEWETLDPTPNIHSLFVVFNNKFFSGRLSCVELEWSCKMYQCAGICYSRRSQVGMACVIRLSEPLLKLRSRKDLVETLLHEMIHAWNFIRGVLEENGGHGQNFLSKMNEINRLAGTNISVYHTFHDEVNLYKKHWWRCDGACKGRSPYYGFVKRTCNRAPGKNDTWWKQHEQSCGGKFIKVKEPERPEKVAVKGKENSKRKAIDESKAKSVKTSTTTTTSTSPDIRKFFKPSVADKDLEAATVKLPSTATATDNAGGGHALGGKATGRSRLLDMFQQSKVSNPAKSLPPKKKRKFNDEDKHADVIVIDDSLIASPHSHNHNSYHDKVKQELKDDDDDIIFIDDEFDDNFPSAAAAIIVPKTEADDVGADNCHCPCCNVLIAITEINLHLDQCLGVPGGV